MTIELYSAGQKRMRPPPPPPLPTPIHPLGGCAQETSETTENKCADIQKVNNCLQQDQFPWEL